jgi:hypothetical protein
MKTFLSIEVGEQKLRYILVEQGSNGLVFKGAGESTVEVGPSAPGALASFVKELVATQKLRVDRLFLTVNRRDIVVHQLNLGLVSKADLEEMIPPEIEKISSFADKEFDYIYQQYEYKSRSKVIFGAMTSDLQQYLLNELRSIRIPCREMEIAPLNLVGLLGLEEFKNEPQALIVLSDHLTYLIVFEDMQVRYLYTTTLGGEILGNLAATMNWGDELKRALKSYSLETKQTVNKAWLVRDKDKSVDFADYLGKELNTNVQPLNIMEGLFGQTVNPIYILAAVPVLYHVTKIKPSFSLNHFLRSSQVDIQFKQAIMAAVGFVLATGIVLGAMIGYFYQVHDKAVAQSQAVQEQIADVQVKSARVINEHNAYLAMRQELLFQATYVQLLKNI